VKGRRRKHIPQRTCIACREKKDKRLLTRIVRTPSDGVVIDRTGKRNGRGAYLCSHESCWDRALNGQVLDKALKTEVTAEEKRLLSKARPAEIEESGG
jgi:predicted RNA-binding protein YlxR (DUF448 family)